MKTVRFASIVEQSGPPEVYLLLVDPKKDPDFQRALREHRVMTLQPGGTGGKTQVGRAGYESGPQAQVIVFPRALKISPDTQVVGIKFDLLHAELEPPRKEATRAKESAHKPTAKAEHWHQEHAKNAKAEGKEHDHPEPEKVMPFPKAEEKKGLEETRAARSVRVKEKAVDETDSVKLKAGIRRALKALEDGKQVAAFNLLKGLVE